MPNVDDLKAKVKELLNLLEGKTSGSGKAKAAKTDLTIPQSEMVRFIATMAHIIEDVGRYVVKPPTRADCEEAMRHPLANQIYVFTTLDKKRKAFFCDAYFETKYAAFPSDRGDFLKATGKKKPGLDVVIFYAWWKSRNSNFSELSRLWDEVQKDYISSLPAKIPTKTDYEASMRHPLANQIYVFITLDKKRKFFFTPDYFKRKYEALPDGREAFLKATGKKNPGVEVLIFFKWWESREADFIGLKQLWEAIQAEYNSSPETRRQNEADSLVQELMGLEDVNEVARRLTDRFATEGALKEFAKLVSLKIPPNPKAKSAPKLTAHERLAKEIHQRGAIARLELD